MKLLGEVEPRQDGEAGLQRELGSDTTSGVELEQEQLSG